MRALQKYLKSPPVNGWRYLALKRVANLQYGAALADSERRPGPFPVYGSNGPVGFHSHALVPGPGIVVGRKGTAGEVVWCEKDFFPIDTTYFVEVDQEQYSLRWLYHLLQHANLGLLQASTGVPGLSRSDAYKLVVPLPQKPEQIRIASALDTVDTATAAIQASIATAQKLKQALMQNLLTGKLKPDGTWRQEDEYYVDPKYGRVPQGWRGYKLKDFGQFLNGANFPGEAVGKGLLFVNLSDVFASPRIDTTRLDRVEVKANKKLRLDVGDLLFVRSSVKLSGIGLPSVFAGADEPVIFCGFLIRFSFNQELVRPDYLCALLRIDELRNRTISLGQIAANTNISQRSLGSIHVVFPESPDEQDSILKALNSVDSAIERREQRIASLRKLKTALMQNLLTGKIRIPAE